MNEFSIGATRELVLVTCLTRTQIVQYAGASGDFNPLHTDELFATRMGFRSVFAHGMLTMGMSARLLEEWFGQANILRYGARFVAQVWPGDTLTARGEITGLEGGTAEVALVTTNQEAVPVLNGVATVDLARLRSGSPRS